MKARQVRMACRGFITSWRARSRICFVAIKHLKVIASNEKADGIHTDFRSSSVLRKNLVSQKPISGKASPSKITMLDAAKLSCGIKPSGMISLVEWDIG